ncbi:hypothetical protein CAJAP_10339 [Camponotus japonicus]
MKNFVVIACLLTISCAARLSEVKKFHNHFKTCVYELNVPEELTIDVTKCLLQKYHAIDEQGFIIPEQLFINFQNMITNESKFYQAQAIASSCINLAYEGPGSNDEKSLTAIKCGILIIKNLFDKEIRDIFEKAQ